MFHKFRKQIVIFFLGVLGCIVFPFGCSDSIQDTPTQIPGHQEKHSGKQYSGEALFRGLIFHYGPAAEIIPEIRDNLKLAYFVRGNIFLKSVIEQYETIIERIRMTHPQFFHEFKKDMQSKNHSRIWLKINDAIRLVDQTIKDMPAYTHLINEDINHSDNNPRIDIHPAEPPFEAIHDHSFLGVDFYFVYEPETTDASAIVQHSLSVVAATVNTAVNAMNHDASTSASGSASGKLLRERIIDSIVKIM